ncbi:YdcF family protein [Candidatus Dojkabacteria bacterium]|nr:YdcF family protein [Candidatus Dojkabacteria bacterium]
MSKSELGKSTGGAKTLWFVVGYVLFFVVMIYWSYWYSLYLTFLILIIGVAGLFFWLRGWVGQLEPKRQAYFWICLLGFPFLELLIKHCIVHEYISYSWNYLNRLEHLVWVLSVSGFLLPVLFSSGTKLKWPIRMGLVVGVITVLGNINEMLEYLIRLLSGKTSDYYLGLFYVDTMIDQLVNLVGAFLGFVLFYSEFFRNRKKFLNRFMKFSLILSFVYLMYFSLISFFVVYFPDFSSAKQADAAIVLGAAQYDCFPSTVLENRIVAAVDLYDRGLVEKIIFTGGSVAGDVCSEAEVGKRYAIYHFNIDPDDILVETSSRTTYGNLYFSLMLMKRYHIQDVIIVSDRFHLFRASLFANYLNIKHSVICPENSSYKSLDTILPYIRKEFRDTNVFLWLIFIDELDSWK